MAEQKKRSWFTTLYYAGWGAAVLFFAYCAVSQRGEVMISWAYKLLPLLLILAGYGIGGLGMYFAEKQYKVTGARPTTDQRIRYPADKNMPTWIRSIGYTGVIIVLTGIAVLLVRIL